MSNANPSNPQTLGQRIDAVLEPLYAETEQHRATLGLIQEQMHSLKAQADAATEGLAKIESRMAEVVRSMANQEPVIAAVLSGDSAADAAAPGVATPASPAQPASPAATPEAAAPAVEPAPPAPPVAETPQPATPEPATPEPAASQAAAPSADLVIEEDTVPLDLDPEVDQAMVDEAASLLDAPPAEDSAESGATANDTAADGPADIAAAAERAAAAAKQLRDSAAAKG